MFDVYLSTALKKEMCPLCQLRQKAEAHYVFHTLWENVNDMTFRLRFLASDGLCPEHAWQFQKTEEKMWHDGLKNSILYESLLAAVRRDLSYQKQARQRAAYSWWHPARWWPRSSPPILLGTGNCPVCTIGESTETFYAGELARNLAKPDWQTAYENSQGLCLPHLRLTLDRSSDTVYEWLVAEVNTRLQTLQRALSEYIRKHSWQFHDEPVSEAERQSWIQAVTFLRGEKHLDD